MWLQKSLNLDSQSYYLHTYFSKSKTQIHRKKRDDNRFSLKGYINLACESFQRLKGCIAITNSKDVLNVKYCQTKQLLNTEILKEIKISKTGNFAETMEKLQALIASLKDYISYSDDEKSTLPFLPHKLVSFLYIKKTGKPLNLKTRGFKKPLVKVKSVIH